MLERHLTDGLEIFSLERRIGYRDRVLGEILIPNSPDFRTDRTSTPALFTWLVPKTGAHLPAALVHDAGGAAACERGAGDGLAGLRRVGAPFAARTHARSSSGGGRRLGRTGWVCVVHPEGTGVRLQRSE